MSKDTKSRTTVSELQAQTIVTKKKEGLSFNAIADEMKIAKSTVRYNYHKEMKKRAVSKKGDIVKAMQTMTLRNKVMDMCDDLVQDVGELGASKEEIQIRVSAINCVKGVVVAFELDTDAPPTTTPEQEMQIIADEILSDLTPEQLEAKLKNIDKRLATNATTNGGLIR